MPSMATDMFAAIALHLRRLLQRRVAREMDDELRFHVEMETQANIERGFSPAEARRLALRDLGGFDQTKEAIRDVRAIWLDSWWQDVRDAGRSLRRRPGIAITAVGMLGLGIGLTTAMFTVVDALILRPSPFHDPDQLALVFMGNEHGGRTTVAPAVLRAWRESPAFAGAESAVPDTGVVEVDGAVATRGSARVTPGIFNLLGGVRPIRGRLFDAADAAAGTNDRVLLSEDAWRGLYHADPAIIGRSISLDGDRLVVVGVLPSEFHFPNWNTAFWRAVDVDASSVTAADRRPMAYVRFAPHVPRPDALRMAAEAARDADGTNATLQPHLQPLAGPAVDAYAQRTFTESAPPGEVVVGERLAGDLWPGLDPIGRSFSFQRERFQVIGLAKEIHHPSLDARLDRPDFYEPFRGIGGYAAISLRCGDGCPNAGIIRQRIAAAQPTVHVNDVRTLEDVYFEQLARPRAAAAVSLVFAGVAVLAAAGGLFSVLSFAVSRRRHEFGIRTALGASPVQIQRAVFRDGMRVAVTGVAIGAVAAVMLARAMSSLEYGVTIVDPLSWILVLGLLGVTTLTAAWRPAREAMHTDPVLLLRRE